MPEPIQTHVAVTCWERKKFPTIFTRTPGIERKAAKSDSERRSITLEHISANYPEEEWTQVYTDGSAIEATRDGDGGVYIKYRAEEAHISVAAGKYATNFKAEAIALNTAATEILPKLGRPTRKLCSSLKPFQYFMPFKTPKTKELNNLTNILSKPNDRVEVTLQWISTYCGVRGESSDTLAKEGCGLEEHDKSVSYKNEKNHHQVSRSKKMSPKHHDFNPTDGYHYLDRADQVILVRLRTGHSRINAHMYSKLKICQMDRCPCDTVPMTSQHQLQDCALHDFVRRETWPKDTSLRDKLFDDPQAPRRTAAIVRMTNVSI